MCYCVTEIREHFLFFFFSFLSGSHSSWFYPAGSDTAVVGIFQRENNDKRTFMISNHFSAAIVGLFFHLLLQAEVASVG